MGRVLAVSNAKGGVGKTSVAVNLAAAFAEQGQRVLLVDCDPQGSATIHLGVDPDKMDGGTTYDVLGGARLEGAVKVVRDNLYLLPANINLAAAEMDLLEEGLPEGARVLAKALAPARELYDRVILDSGPTFGILTLNVLACADSLLIPVAADYLSMQALRQQLRIVERVRGKYNAGLRVAGIVVTMADLRTNAATVVLQQLRQAMQGRHPVYQTVLRQSVVFREAAAAGEPLTQYAPHHPSAQAVRELALEVGNG